MDYSATKSDINDVLRKLDRLSAQMREPAPVNVLIGRTAASFDPDTVGGKRGGTLGTIVAFFLEPQDPGFRPAARFLIQTPDGRVLARDINTVTIVEDPT